MTETPGLRKRLIAAKIAGGRTGQGYEFRSNENAADVALGVVTAWLREQERKRRGDFPPHSISLTGRTWQDIGDITEGVQYAVLDPDGERRVYGDQSWVAYGACVKDGSHPDGRIQRREVRISYGEWADVPEDFQ